MIGTMAQDNSFNGDINNCLGLRECTLVIKLYFWVLSLDAYIYIPGFLIMFDGNNRDGSIKKRATGKGSNTINRCDQRSV